MRSLRFALPALIIILMGCKTKQVQHFAPVEYVCNQDGKGTDLTLTFQKGEAFNHPLMAVWLEDTSGTYLQTLYVAESIGRGVFNHGDPSTGKWMPGEIRRPSALPYWSHKRGILAEDGLFLPTPRHPVADAYTGPTPSGDFILRLKSDKPLSGSFAVLFEINQSWDWNEYWTNNKFPGDDEYKTSCQPALVYKALIDTDQRGETIPLQVIGHSHYSGKNGNLYTDLTTMTTAMNIAQSIVVKVE